MYFKLSMRNMKRSLSDYGIYFVTLMLAVSLFYTFSSISDQRILLDLSQTQLQVMQYLDQIMMIASIIVTSIFGLLCIFANNFLIKRRKKEFGLYMSLGMSKFAVSTILIMETLLVSAGSLVTGLSLGVLFSQGMSVFTAALFEIQMKEFQFVFSINAALATVVLFTIMFVITMALNVFSVSRYELIELLKASQKGEQILIKSQKLNAILTGVSLMLLASGYVVMATTTIQKGINTAILGILAVLVGTTFFYLSGLPFLLEVLKNNAHFRDKEINIFNIRQMTAKANSGAVTMICTSLLLFFTMVILSTSFSYKKAVEKELELIAPFDSSLVALNFSDNQRPVVDEIIEELKIDTSNMDYFGFDLFVSPITAGWVLRPYSSPILSGYLDGETYAMKYSDYIEVAKMQGIQPVSLGQNEVLILTNMNEGQESIKKLTENTNSINFDDIQLNFTDEKYQLAAIQSENIGRMVMCFVVPDEIAATMQHRMTITNFMYDKEKYPEKEMHFQKIFTFSGQAQLSNADFSIHGTTRAQAYEDYLGRTTNLIFVGVYLGIVFLISSGAVLGLRQLSDASDEVQRYAILRRIGASNKLIDKSVLIQVLSYFAFPLIIAIPNAVLVSNFFFAQLQSTGQTVSIIPALFTSLIILAIYGGYFLITFSGYKRIVR